MAARKDTPEMFEAFKFADAERRRQALANAQRVPSGGEKKPEVEKKGEPEPVKDSPPVRPVVTSEGSGSRGGSNLRTERPWSQMTRGAEGAFYLPLGQRCKIVVAMSYPVAIAAGVILLVALILAFVLGKAFGGGDASAQGTTVGEQYEAEGEGGQGSGESSDGGTSTDVLKAVAYRVRAASVRDNALGRAEADEMKKVLEDRGYQHVDVLLVPREGMLGVFVGAFTEEGKGDAEALRDKVRGELFRGRKAFDSAYLVHRRPQ